jgi:D-alanyl-D-alanine carboxypeptidase/D-alanyl-D-alanine-endopeptidase (penicillin-binding protein 4)
MILALLLPPANADLVAILNDARFKGCLVSATVADLSGNILFGYNETQRVIPASNQKLLTCAFALNALGPTYHPKTRFWKKENRLIIEAPGDPSMTFDQLKDAATTLKTDSWTSVYLREAYAPGVPDSWEHDDLPNKYAARVTAFTVDRGSFELWNVNGKPKLLPSAYGVRIETLQSPVEFIRYDPHARKVTMAATLGPKSERLDTLAIPRPDEAACNFFGRLRGGVDTVPNAPPTLVIEGKSIADVVADCLPPSDNNLAENLLLMAASKEAALGINPYAVARERFERFLTDTVNISRDDFRVFDGSGMSRHNLVTTRGITQLLSWADRQPTRALWRAALAYPGKGTLAKRLNGIDFRGKTGSLDLVASLSGYLKVKDGRDVVVSVVVNNYLCPDNEARSVLDSFVRAVRDADLAPPTLQR